MSYTGETVSRKELEVFLGLPREFVDLWLHEDRAKEYDAGRNPVPQIPHLAMRPMRFHLPTVRAWLLKHHQKGGDRES